MKPTGLRPRVLLLACVAAVSLCAASAIAQTPPGSAPAPAPSDFQTLLLAGATLLAASVAGIDEWLKSVITNPTALFLATLGVGAFMTGAGMGLTQAGNGATASHAEFVAVTGAIITIATGLQNLVQAMRKAKAKAGGLTGKAAVVALFLAAGGAGALAGHQTPHQLPIELGPAACNYIAPVLPAQLQSIEQCVVGELQAGDDVPANIIAKCGPSLAAAVWDEIMFLLNDPATAKAHPGLVAAAHEEMVRRAGALAPTVPK